MAVLVYILSFFSATYEMIMLMLAFREYVTWRLSLVWCALLVGILLFGQVATSLFPLVPLGFFWVVPLTLVNTFMAARLLYTKWLLMLPIAIFLNAFKRLIGGLAGSFLKWLTSSDAPMLLRQVLSLHNWAAELNLFGAVILGLPVFIIVGVLAHHFFVRVAAADYLQHATVARRDYWLVGLFYMMYVLAYAYILELSVVMQALVAVGVCLIFGIIGTYLINNNNSRLKDAQLLQQMSRYNGLLSHRNQQLHLFKHDYQNILLSMSQFIQAGDMPGLKTYFDEQVTPASKALTVNIGPEQLRDLQAPAISGLIYSKYESAHNRQVKLKINILQPIKLPALDRVNIVRILGNLLDNAIDAAAQVDHQVQLTITVVPKTTDVRFQIQNKIPKGNDIDLGRIKKSRFTTKPGHLGYGLSSIEQLATKRVSVNYQIDDENFLATLVIHQAKTA